MCDSGPGNCPALDKQAMPGYYNSSESSWGGFPIKGDDGSYYLVHAQMANHCDLGSWTENSIEFSLLGTSKTDAAGLRFLTR
jgi:hypothetical protein